MGTSPAQRLFGRQCKTQLPTTKELLKPQFVGTEAVKKTICAQQRKTGQVLQQKGMRPLPSGRRSCGTDEAIYSWKEGVGKDNGDQTP